MAISTSVPSVAAYSPMPDTSASGSSKNKTYWGIIFLPVLAKLALHLIFIQQYGFHRDELLYLSLGNHPDLGFWSNPPLIGWISWCIQNFIGTELWAVRIVPVVTSCLLVVMTGCMAKEMGAGRYGQFLAAFAATVSPAFLRSGHMFQPVVFDIFFWTLLTFILVKYLNTGKAWYIPLFGLILGLGFLTKYLVAFLLVAVVIALLLTPHRRVLVSRPVIGAVILGFLVVAPNLYWQAIHRFPVVIHMSDLVRTQLTNVNPVNFLLDQLFLMGAGILLWIPGLFWVFFGRKGRTYRLIGFLFVAVIGLFLVTNGKNYYTLGIYPVLLAAGSVSWELLGWKWLRPIPPILILVLSGPILPFALPVLPPDMMAQYGKTVVERTGIDGLLRWEDGKLHDLPQDYADMLGWRRIAWLADYARDHAGEPVLVYGENYGQAAAVEHLVPGAPRVVSFSDSYRMWAPLSVKENALIYINQELGDDVMRLFSEIIVIGKVDTPYARESGTTVYLCRKPVRPLAPFWNEQVTRVRKSFVW